MKHESFFEELLRRQANRERWRLFNKTLHEIWALPVTHLVNN